MQDRENTKERLIEELAMLRKRIAELEATELKRKEAEEALRESEERFRQLAENIKKVFWIADRDITKIFYISPAYEEIWGRTCASLLANPRSWMGSVHPEDLELVKKSLAERGSGGHRMEYRIVRPDGSIRWILDRGFPVRDETGEICRFAGIAEDITERVQQEREIRLLNRLYSVLSRVSQAVVRATSAEAFLEEACRVIVEEGGLLLAWIGYVEAASNKVIPTAMWGEGGGYVRGISVYADDRPEGRGPTGTCIREERPSVHNDFLHSPLTLPWRNRAAPFGIRAAAAFPIRSAARVWGALTIYSDEVDFFGDKDVKLLEKVADDIGFALDNLEREGQRHKTEEALRERERTWATLISNLPGFVYRCANDRDWTMEYISEGCLEITGYAPEDFLYNKTLAYNDIVHTEYREPLWKQWQESLPARKTFEEEYPIVTAGGQIRWVWERGRGIYAEDGRLLYLEGFIADITERKRAEEALRESEEKYRSLFEHSQDAILLTVPDGSILDANPAACRMFGRSLDEIKNVGRSGLVDVTDPRLSAALNERARRGLATSEITMLRANGDKFPAEITSTIFVDASGRQKTSMIIRDISERKRSDEALKERDIQFKKLSLNVPGMIYQFMKKPDGTYCCPFTTEAIKDIFGCSPQDVREDFSPIVRVILPEDLDKLMHSIESSAERLTTWQCEYRVQIPGQPIRWMFGQSTPEKLGDGSILWHGFNTDITERKQAEAALQASEREKTTLNEIANVFLTMPDERIYEEVLKVVLKRMQSGYGVFGFISEAGDLVIPSMTREVWSSCQVPDKSIVFPGHTWGNSLWGRAIREQQPFSSDGPFHTPEGHVLIDNFLTVPVIFGSKTIGLLSVANKEGGFTEEDKIQMGRIVNAISPILNARLERDRQQREREKAEKALRDSSVRFEAQYQGIPVPTFTWQQQEGDFVLVNYNRAAVALTDGKVVGYLGRMAGEVYRDRPDILRDLHLCATQKQIIRKEIVSGHFMPGRDIVATFIFVPSDLIMVHMEDITERKQAERDRRNLQDRLHRAEKMEALGTLAGGVAHDLNNVLGIVVGYSELLLGALPGSGPASAKAREILKGGQRAAAIVQDLLTLARRGVQGRMVVNLNSIVTECLKSPEFSNLLSYHPNVQIKTDLEPDLLNLSGSSVHLGKSLFNLMSNAAEAMSNGGILTVRTANRYLDKPICGYDEVREGDYVVLSLSDTGEGIPAPDLKRIFEPFYTKKVMGRSGTGLGLAVVWGTVKDHLGYINVESEEGKGTTFTLYFPVTREEAALEQASVSVAEYMGKGEIILVVDDVKEQRDLATAMLTKLNYVATSASSGEEAVEYLEKQSVDLIVLDMIMDPGMDGLDTYAKILERHPHQKAIIVSGFSETERVSKAQALGAGAYVKKPYVMEKLGLAVRKELERVA